MGDVERAMAKLAAIQKAVESAVNEVVNRSRAGKEPPQYRRSYEVAAIGMYFTQAAQNLEVLRRELPEWFSDFQALAVEPDVEGANKTNMFFSPGRLKQLSRDIGQIMEIRANAEHASHVIKEPPRRAFISHGRARDWYEVQAHVERDLDLRTMELAQEPSQGRTVIEKLEANAPACDSAIIVMSGDDEDADGQLRVRENVMHEIGYFQGRYGRRCVILLHEEGVNVPTNLAGIVYVPYPKETVSAAFGVLDRELKALYGSQPGIAPLSS
ncbi:nucleotide-binding protein [Variovorax sp. LjRoot84]|uniref:TIR domain-containing protein n=1 Tax=Variovorax sp. LjRoot84 TaxID=3342340 RepID=UPI003ED0B2D8